MKTIIRASLIVLAVTVGFSTLSAAESAADIYKTKCAICHGATGAGDTAVGKNLKIRDLSSADVQKQSDAELANVIKIGKGKMPKYEGKLPDQQINDLVNYIRALKR
jgi:cytochrome c6